MSEVASHTTGNVETITGLTDDEFDSLTEIDQGILFDKIAFELEQEHLESIHAELVADAMRDGL